MKIACGSRDLRGLSLTRSPVVTLRTAQRLRYLIYLIYLEIYLLGNWQEYRVDPRTDLLGVVTFECFAVRTNRRCDRSSNWMTTSFLRLDAPDSRLSGDGNSMKQGFIDILAAVNHGTSI